MFQTYIDFIINNIIADSAKLQFSYGWNVILVPYFYWLFIFLFKYLILTLPVWAPINMVFSNKIQYVKSILPRNLK